MLARALLTGGILMSLGSASVASPDYLTFAQGAIPLSATIDGVAMDAYFAGNILAIDGSPTPLVLIRSGTATSKAELVFALPAATTFTRFAVPNINEVPSLGTTFVKQIEVHGSAKGPTDGYELLASATLAAHKTKGEVTELKLAKQTAVRWVKVTLSGGLDVRTPKVSIQFSELLGHGTQESAPLSTGFTGSWADKGVLIELRQAGATVTGCYDKEGKLDGTVSGDVLRAVGIDIRDKVKSLFVLTVGADGRLRGLRSTNGAPFKIYTGPAAPAGTKTQCRDSAPPKLGCGAVIQAINFDFDSAAIRADSTSVLDDLFAGLKADPAKAIVIEGHTSSEGTAAHNVDLSKRRAQAVVEELIRRGLPKTRLTSAGKGPAEPIASNADETGRAMNRRVEVECR
jgi:OmpA-OmpF porin, OOP family